MKNFTIAIGLSISLLFGQEATRQIWDTGFLQKRPSHVKPDQPKVATHVKYETTATPEEQKHATQAVIGITLWRLRQPTPTDDNNARLLVQDIGKEAAATQFVPERIYLSDPLHEGDRVRLSIEAPRFGFLYVIDRERYSDGSVGDPVLIFPAGNFNYGLNDVEPGRMVEIPPQTSKVPALRVTRNGERHIGEELLIVIMKDWIPDLKIEDRETKLSPDQVARWEKDWGVDPMRLDLTGNEHNAWTRAEKDAGASRRLLSQSDPMPATIFSVSPAGDKPLLLRIPLEIRNR